MKLLAPIKNDEDIVNKKYVDSIDIGSRNIVTGTANMVIGSGKWEKGHWRQSGTGTIETIDISDSPVAGVSKGIKITASSISQNGIAQDLIPLNSNNAYTLSCWVRGSSSAVRCRLQPYYASSTDNGGYGQFTLNSEWQYISYTVTKNPANIAAYSGAYVYLIPVAAGDTLEVCGIKLERGNKATDWSPAPEDKADKDHTHSDYLPLTGGTITGRTVFSSGNTSWNLKSINTNFEKGTIPTDYTTYWVLNFMDKIGADGKDVHENRIGYLDSYVAKTTGTTITEIVAMKNEKNSSESAKIAIGKRIDGTEYLQLGSSTIGGIDTPVYINAGQVTPCNLLPFIVGTQTAATGTWTGNAPTISALFDGLTIRYWLPYNSSGNATLNLTLANGKNTGDIDCYYGGTARLTTHYGAGNIITLTYRENITIAGSEDTYTGWWADANYNVSNTAGSTNTASKIFLIGTTSQTTATKTYSNSNIYAENGTLILSKTTDASGTANNSPALIVGGTSTQPHLEFDANEIMAKKDVTTPSDLTLNADGGTVYIGYGGNGPIRANTFTGIHNYEGRNGAWSFNIIRTDFTKGDIPTSKPTYWGLNFMDKNGGDVHANRVGYLSSSVDTSGNSYIGIYAMQNVLDSENSASIVVGKNINGKEYLRLGTSTIGSADTPIYINGGIITSTGKKFSDYLPLSGGNMTGNINIKSNTTDCVILGQHTASGSGDVPYGYIYLYNSGSLAGNITGVKDGGLKIRSGTNNTGSIGDSSHYFDSAYINNLDKVTMIKESGDTYHRAERTDLTFTDSKGKQQHEDIRFGISNAGNRGIWDRRLEKWLVRSDTSGNAYFGDPAYADKTTIRGRAIIRIAGTAGTNINISERNHALILVNSSFNFSKDSSSPSSSASTMAFAYINDTTPSSDLRQTIFTSSDFTCIYSLTKAGVINLTGNFDHCDILLFD